MDKNNFSNILNSYSSNIDDKNISTPISPRRMLNSLSPRTLKATLSALSPDKLDLIKDIEEEKESKKEEKESKKEEKESKKEEKEFKKEEKESKKEEKEFKKEEKEFKKEEKEFKKEEKESKKEEKESKKEEKESRKEEKESKKEEKGSKKEEKGSKKEEIQIEKSLKDLGYFLEERLIVNTIIDNKSINSVFFVKCISPRGNIVYIDLDLDGEISIFTDDILLHEHNNNVLIENSVKSGILSNIPDDIRGITMDVGYGYYFLIKDGKDIIEKNFLFSKELQVINYEFIYPLPILRLSSILNEPIISLDRIDHFHKKMGDNSSKIFKNVCIKLEDEITKIKTLFPEFENIELAANKELIDSLNILKENLIKTTEDPKLINNEKYNLIIFNLDERNKRMIELLDIYNYINNATIQISEINNNLLKYNNLLKNNFSKLDKVYVR